MRLHLDATCHHGNRNVCGHCIREAREAGKVWGEPPRVSEGFDIFTPAGMRAALTAARKMARGRR